jgi:serine/threonine protein kinase
VNGKEVEDVKMMHEVARGMEYLHSMGVLHCDLKVSYRMEGQIRASKFSVLVSQPESLPGIPSEATPVS